MYRIAIIENNIIATLSVRKKLILTLSELGHDVVVLTTGSLENFESARNVGLNVIDVGTCTLNPTGIIRYCRSLRTQLKAFVHDICLTFTIRPAIWGNFVSRACSIPTITTITGIGHLFERNNFLYWFSRQLYKFALKRTAKVFFQNADDLNIFLKRKLVTSNTIELVPGSGVDLEYFRPMEKSSSLERIDFLLIARLLRDKGVIEFVECAKLFIAKGYNIKFAIIGPFYTQNHTANTISLSEIDDWVKHKYISYLGEQQDVRQFIANSECVVLPTYREGISNVLLEASSMAKPCITCHVAGCKDIIEDNYNGLLCLPQSVDSLCSAILKMYQFTPEQRKIMGENGRKKIIKEFNKQIVIEAYLQALNSVLN